MTACVEIYTDGSCINNPGNGGWAALIKDGKIQTQISGFVPNTTNNRMELLAAIMSIKKIDINRKIIVNTDSKYLQNGITTWIYKWLENNWRTSNKSKVKNLDLWQELLEIINSRNIQWNWVKAHDANCSENDYVDKLAKKAAKNKIVNDTTKLKDEGDNQ